MFDGIVTPEGEYISEDGQYAAYFDDDFMECSYAVQLENGAMDDYHVVRVDTTFVKLVDDRTTLSSINCSNEISLDLIRLIK